MLKAIALMLAVLEETIFHPLSTSKVYWEPKTRTVRIERTKS